MTQAISHYAELVAERYALRKEIEELRQNADRYTALRNWLISEDDYDPFTPRLEIMLRKVQRERGESALPTQEEFDSVIDDAMKNETP